MVEKAGLIDLKASANDFSDFEFCLDDPVKMLPADELFSNGKLRPLHLCSVKPILLTSPDTPKPRRRNGGSVTDPQLFSPRAPRCSSRWKEILGLKRLAQREKENNQKSTLSSTTKSLKSFLNRSSKATLSSSLDSSLNLPLLKDSDTESVSVSSSRVSLSSSSSGHEHDDLPRLSLDSDNKQINNNQRYVSDLKSRMSSSEKSNIGVRVGQGNNRRRQQETNNVITRGVSAESPRMNSSGKIIFHSLERSSSTPTTSQGGGARYKNRGMERSYSANVHVTRVLNVPVGSLRGSASSKSSSVFGFPLFSSSLPRKDGCNRNNQHLNQKNSNKNRIDKLTEPKQKL